MDEIQLKKEQIIKYAKYGGLAAILVLVLPFMFGLAAMAAGTVVAAAITAIGGIALVNFLPVFGMRMANWRLGAIKAEARKNPIETAQNQLLEMNEQLSKYKQVTQDRIAAGDAMKSDVAKLRETDPEGAESFQARIEAFEIEKVDRESRIAEMVKNIDEATREIERAAKLWELEQRHSKFKEPTEADQALKKIIMDTALSEVMRAAQQSSAKITVDAMVSKARKTVKDERAAKVQAITNQPSAVPRIPEIFEVEVVEIKKGESK